jgi:hypothetical protein
MYRRRCGVTLTEVLVAIFVCGLGLMALMTLFPLGALNMAQAIKDDRCGHAAANASAILRSVWRVSLETGGKIPAGPGTFVPDPALLSLETALRSGPVYLDPLGANMYAGLNLPGGIQRRNLGLTFQQALRWCSLLDDIDFNPNATPQVWGTEISRQARYSWAWMLRWPRGFDTTLAAGAGPRMRAVEFSVVVYHNRPMNQTPGLVPVGETAYTATFWPAPPAVPQAVVIPYAGVRPSIKKGGWIMDATRDAVTGQPHGYFYRVIGIQDLGPATGLVLTVQTPFRGAMPAQGTIVFMDNVAEVFERSTLE